MTEAEYISIGERLGEAMQGASFKIGDFVNIGKLRFGYKDYERVAEITGLDQVYLRQCSSISERVEPQFRTLASLERFRLLLPKREKIVKDGKPAELESIPSLVARFDDWTQKEIRDGKKALPPSSAASTGSAAGTAQTPDDDAGDSKKPAEKTPEAAALAAATVDKPKGEMTATAIYEQARALQIGIELLSPDRLTMLSVMEQKFAVIKPLGAMLRLLSEQIRTELHK
jgi:hypothetical protein